MAIEIAPGPRVAAEDVNEFERELSGPLPEKYRQFLVDSNGGQPGKNLIVAGEYQMAVRYFYSINGSGTRDIRWALRGTGPFPDGHIPIACDDGGNSFILAIAGPMVGAVYFWDHERELEQPDPDQPDLTPATLLSTDFSTFLDALRGD